MEAFEPPYREYMPAPALQEYIKFFWVLKMGQPLPAPERIFPDGCMEMILHLGQPLSRITGTSSYVQPKAFIVGQIKNPLFLLSQSPVHVIGVRFKPWGMAALCKQNLHAIEECEIELDSFFGNTARELEEKIHTLPLEAAIHTIEQFLLFKLKTTPQSPAIINMARVAAHIKQDTTGKTVAAWAGNCNLSQRQFNRQFKAIIGLAPKEFIKISRFNKVITHMQAGNSPSLAALAQHCGYYDQAHFIKEFKEYTRTTPGNFQQNSQLLIPA